MTKINFKGGAIISSTTYNHICEYDVANYKSMAQFDGCGNIKRYSVANKWDIITAESWYSGICINGNPINVETEKKVSMIGKNQTVEIEYSQMDITIKQFMDEKSNAVFCEYHFKNLSSEESKVEINFGYRVEDSGYILSKAEETRSVVVPDRKVSIEPKYVQMEVAEEYYVDAAFNKEVYINEVYENRFPYFRYKALVGGNSDEVFRIVISGGNKNDSSYCNVKEAILNFDAHYAESLKYIEKLRSLIKSEDEKLKAMFISCMNCSLSSYKEVEENGFQGFFAGINYQKPARTYFRDGYWTIQSILPFFPELVRNQILSLAKGVHEDGQCPSAVIYSNEIQDFWSDHYDSPLFFIMMIYDYLCFSGDFELLSEKIKGSKVIDLMENCIQRFSKEQDEVILIAKPEFCRRDWVDNIYRDGYVTYIEALYGRALYCMERIFSKLNNTKAAFYGHLFLKCKKDINGTLWNDKTGYYYNYIFNDRKEDNLSIDSILTVLYDIADEKKKESVLNKCEEILETIHNKEQKYGDWGVMCAYPFYKYKSDLVEKSNFEYRYHNGSDWPYLDGLYALVKMKNNREFKYPLTRWFDYSMEKGWFTPIEYYDPVYGKGSYLQAWSSMPAAAIVMGGFNLTPDIDGNVAIINKELNCTISQVRLRDKVIELT